MDMANFDCKCLYLMEQNPRSSHSTSETRLGYIFLKDFGYKFASIVAQILGDFLSYFQKWHFLSKTF